MMSSVSLQAMLAVQQGLMERPGLCPKTLSTHPCPAICVVAVRGEDQSSTPPEMRVIIDQAPDAEFHLLENAGHYAPFEQPQEFASLIGDFLDRKYQINATRNPTRKSFEKITCKCCAPVSSYGGTKDRELFCDRVSLRRAWCANTAQPLYVYSATNILDRVRMFAAAFAGMRATLCYSVKANPNLSILRMLADTGFGL